MFIDFFHNSLTVLVDQRRTWNFIRIFCAFISFSYILLKIYTINAATTSLLFVILLLGIIYIFRHPAPEQTYSKMTSIYILSALFSFSFVTGLFFEYGNCFSSLSACRFLMWLFCSLSLIPIFRTAILWFFFAASRASSLSKHCRIDNYNAFSDIKYEKRTICKIFLFSFVLIMIFWTIIWFAYYPGIFSYDPKQVNQYITSDYNTHHPLIHTLLLGFCYSIGLKAGSRNLGIAIYSWIQMIFMASVFSYCCTYVHRSTSESEKTRSSIITFIVIIFYAIMPFNSMLAISTTKDVIFSGLVLLCFLFAINYIEKQKIPSHTIALLIISATVMMLFRNNAIYSFIIFALLSFLFSKKIDKYKMVLFIILLCIGSFSLANTSLTAILDASKGSMSEMLSIPANQMGRIYESVYYSEIPEDIKTKELIESYFSEDIKDQYNPSLSDPLKKCFIDEIQKNDLTAIVSVLKTSVQLFFQYPVVSIDSFLYLSKGLWDIQDTSFTVVYGSDNGLGYLITFSASGDYIPSSKLPRLRFMLEQLFPYNGYQRIPLISIFLSPATYLWLLLLCMTGFYINQKWNYLFLANFLLGLVITVAAAPCQNIRYNYPIIVCCPLLIIMLINSFRIKCSTG